MSDSVRVLIVDDSEFSGMRLAGELSKEHDLETIQTDIADATLAYLDTHEVDCVVSDYDMPDTDGIELFHRIEDRGIDDYHRAEIERAAPGGAQPRPSAQPVKRSEVIQGNLSLVLETLGDSDEHSRTELAQETVEERLTLGEIASSSTRLSARPTNRRNIGWANSTRCVADSAGAATRRILRP